MSILGKLAAIAKPSNQEEWRALYKKYNCYVEKDHRDRYYPVVHGQYIEDNEEDYELTESRLYAVYEGDIKAAEQVIQDFLIDELEFKIERIDL